MTTSLRIAGHRSLRSALPAALLATLLAAPATLAPVVPAHAAPAHAPRPAPAPTGEPGPAGKGAAAKPDAPTQQDAIVAVVNGEPVTRSDVTARARLFALSTGLPISPELLERLRPQITRQLIDERLRAQEIQRRKIVVSDADVAEAIGEIEKRNNLPPGQLRDKLEGEGVAARTLFDQIRTQIGWTRVLREMVGEKIRPSEADIAEKQRAYTADTGKPEYHVGEIFVTADDPAHQQDALKFADTVIQQLRAGAPFAVVAAQFSQNQTALEGGDLGWVRLDQLDPPVAEVVKAMPDGAISNPIAVPGGVAIVTQHGKRELGRDTNTVLSIREAFFPFTAALDPRAPTDQQKHQLVAATELSRARDCSAVEAANKAAGAVRPADPGPLTLETVNPQMRALLTGLQPGHASKPLVAPEGIAIIMVCSRETKAAAAPEKQALLGQMVEERVELASRQLQRDLRRKALIEQRS
ncbi:MAG: peptidylprolyl isomerase [Janthinobacterium lividum]